MQERYSVNYYSPGINIVRNRDEYVWTQDSKITPTFTW